MVTIIRSLVHSLARDSSIVNLSSLIKSSESHLLVKPAKRLPRHLMSRQ